MDLTFSVLHIYSVTKTFLSFFLFFLFISFFLTSHTNHHYSTHINLFPYHTSQQLFPSPSSSFLSLFPTPFILHLPVPSIHPPSLPYSLISFHQPPSSFSPPNPSSPPPLHSFIYHYYYRSGFQLTRLHSFAYHFPVTQTTTKVAPVVVVMYVCCEWESKGGRCLV